MRVIGTPFATSTGLELLEIDPLLTDALWTRIEPLLPPHKPRRRRFPGRKPIDDRKALTGILFVLKTGINWEDLPQEMGCGCGMTCWRRLRDWNQAGVWQTLHETLLAELHEADRIDWARRDRQQLRAARAVVDGRARALSTAARGGASTRSSPMRAGFRSWRTRRPPTSPTSIR